MFTVDLGMIWSGFLVHQVKGCLGRFQPSMKVLILIVQSRMEGKAPRRMAWRDDPEPDFDQVQPRSRRQGEVDVDPRVRGQPSPHPGPLVVA